MVACAVASRDLHGAISIAGGAAARLGGVVGGGGTLDRVGGADHHHQQRRMAACLVRGGAAEAAEASASGVQRLSTRAPYARLRGRLLAVVPALVRPSSNVTTSLCA